MKKLAGRRRSCKTHGCGVTAGPKDRFMPLTDFSEPEAVLCRQPAAVSTPQPMFPWECAPEIGAILNMTVSADISWPQERSFVSVGPGSSGYCGGRGWDGFLNSASDYRARAHEAPGFTFAIVPQTKDPEVNALREELEQARALGELGLIALGALHDFKNYIFAVTGNADMLRLVLEGIPPSKPREDALRLLDSMARAARMSGDVAAKILAFARKSDEPLTEFDPNELAQEAVALVRMATMHKNVDYAVEPDCSPYFIRGDRVQVQRAIFNVIFNAAGAITEKGKVSVSVSNASLHGSPAVSIRVADTGCGMSRETLACIFEPFFTGGKEKGTGLGLAVAKSVVDSHNGTISVESEPGKGTVFEIVLPSARPSEPPPSVPLDAALIRLPGKVLIVEDEEMLRRLGEKMISKTGNEVLLARDGREGLRTFLERKDEVAVVILDLRLPDAEGEDLIGEIRSASGSVGIIVTSGAVQDYSERMLLSLGADGILPKPYSMDDLFSTINSLFPRGGK